MELIIFCPERPDIPSINYNLSRESLTRESLLRFSRFDRYLYIGLESDSDHTFYLCSQNSFRLNSLLSIFLILTVLFNVGFLLIVLHCSLFSEH